MNVHKAPCMSRPRLALGALMACALVAPLSQAQISQKEVDKQLEELTQTTYQAGKDVHRDRIGKSDTKQGGWPGPPEQQLKFRFIRLDHGGKGWDDGMDKSGADANFLKELAKQTGFKAAEKGEAHKISLLKKYPKDGFPPFVFITGNHRMGRIAAGDLRVLRDYCLKGGMIIADAGSHTFHQSFVHVMRQVFPDKPLIDIANDDMIYQLPYSFPDGPPAFWAHGGRRPLGIKHEGRWVCFYHPGDMNDTWKSQGYTDVDPQTREVAMKLGINLVFYAFNQWHAATTPDEDINKQDIIKQDSSTREVPDTDLFNPKN